MLTTFIAAANIALLALISVLLLPDSKTRANRYLFAFFALLSLTGFLRIGFLMGGSLLIWLPFVVFPGGFLLGPLLFLYVRSTLFNQRTTRTETILLSIAPVCVFVAHCMVNLTHPETADPTKIQTMDSFVGNYTRALFFIGSLYDLGFLMRGFFLLRRYRLEFVNNFSTTLRDEQSWIWTLLLLTSGLALTYLTMSIFTWASGSFFVPVGWPEGLVMLILAYLAIFYYIKKPQIFAIQQIDPQTVPESSNKYARQNLSDAMRKEYLKKIEDYFAEEKPYLDERVTLTGLSTTLGIPAHHFSMVINIEKNLNFFNFINTYRIEEAMRMLDNPATAVETVLSIAFSAGFQSKAVFNRVFKEHTGLTPTAYRARKIQKNS